MWLKLNHNKGLGLRNDGRILLVKSVSTPAVADATPADPSQLIVMMSLHPRFA
jgi:hypothetical protein